MNSEGLYTADSLKEHHCRKIEGFARSNLLIETYRQDHSAWSQSPELIEWIRALEDSNLDVAASADLWSRLSAAGHIEYDQNQGVHGNRATFHVRVPSAKILDAFQAEKDIQTGLALTTIKICMRRDEAPKALIPPGWQSAYLVDTELFELPHGTTLDPEEERKALDDMEKIHLIYLVGTTKNEGMVSKPVYIGVGTGEAYGSGPSHRGASGRYRFYRYDRKDNNHLEFVKVTEGPESQQSNVSSVPEVPQIDPEKDKVTLLLARGGGDAGFMCFSDPHVLESQKFFFKNHILSSQITKLVTLEKIHEKLGQRSVTGTPFQADNVKEVLVHAWNVYRWYYAAWLHPKRLTNIEGLSMYYKRLPAWRREQYEIRRIRLELFGSSPGFALEVPPTIPQVVTDPELRSRLEQHVPGAVNCMEDWLRSRLIDDLYSFGNHPELRLCSAIALWKRLADNGMWDQMVKATYLGRLYDVNLGMEAFCSNSI